MTHNPWSQWCGKRVDGEPFRDGERCPTCEPTVRRAPWSCTTDDVTFPGCGRCGPCRQALAAGWAALAAVEEAGTT